jgi:hypothetical protein
MNIEELEVTLKMLNIDYFKKKNIIVIDTQKVVNNSKLESIIPLLEQYGYKSVCNYIEGYTYILKDLEEE